MDAIKNLEADIIRIERRIARVRKMQKLCRFYFQSLARIVLARGHHPSFSDKSQVLRDKAFVGQLGYGRYSDLLARLDKLSWTK